MFNFLIHLMVTIFLTTLHLRLVNEKWFAAAFVQWSGDN